jgi:TRAP-type mannitol/chloroaromatic compound transport system permease small subunit
MPALLMLSGLIDRLNALIGRLAMWLILATTVISAWNAIQRKAFNISSNAWLEIQWYLFAAVFMLGAGYTLLRNAHVRIDFVAGRFTPPTRNWIDVIGILAVLFPFCIIAILLSWPLFVNAWNSGEMSSNAGGLVRWPIYLLIPTGFALLMLQGLSELIKRIAFLRGAGPDTIGLDGSEAEKLANEIAGDVAETHAAVHPEDTPLVTPSARK